jgi:hypothetical protein
MSWRFEKMKEFTEEELIKLRKELLEEKDKLWEKLSDDFKRGYQVGFHIGKLQKMKGGKTK